MQLKTCRLMAMIALAWLMAASSVLAHEGHDHGAPPPPVSATIAPRAEASSSDFELVATARGGELIFHLDAYATNEPVIGAELDVDTPAGVLKAEPKAAGVYVLQAPFIIKPGRYDLAITVSANGAVDILAATLTIPDRPSNEPAAGSWLTAPAIAQGLRPTGGDAGLPLWMVAGLGVLAGLGLIVLIARRRRPAALASLVGLLCLSTFSPVSSALADEAPAPAVARDQAQRFPDGALFVPKGTQHILGLRTMVTVQQAHRRTIELPGRIIPNPNASGLVQASVGGRLGPPPGGFKPLGTPVKAGDVLAMVRPPLPLADATSQQQQARELDQQISIVTRKVERLRSIREIVARSQLEDAELELKGLQTRRANLDRVQREAEALVAPVDGIIAASNAVAGQMAEPNAIIFQIVDPTSLWVEALSYDAQVTSGKARAQLGNGNTIDLEYVGAGFTDRNQSIPIHFAIVGPTKALRAGQFVTVLAETTEEQRGIAIPREAVLRGSNGQNLVYEHTNAERFMAREVRVAPLDGSNVLILAGVEAGRRIVTQGAELLNQIQ